MAAYFTTKREENETTSARRCRRFGSRTWTARHRRCRILKDFRPKGTSEVKKVQFEEMCPYKMPEGFQAAPHWEAQLPDHAFLSQEEPSIWKQDTAVQVEIDMPENRNASEKALKSLQSYFAASLKRKAIEVSEKTPDIRGKIGFSRSKNRWRSQTSLLRKPLKHFPSGYKASRSDAVKMRWILTWKTLPCGGRKAKARAVLLGYMDPSYSERATNITNHHSTDQTNTTVDSCSKELSDLEGRRHRSLLAIKRLPKHSVVHTMP